jgi:hypothetical protein
MSRKVPCSDACGCCIPKGACMRRRETGTCAWQAAEHLSMRRRRNSRLHGSLAAAACAACSVGVPPRALGRLLAANGVARERAPLALEDEAIHLDHLVCCSVQGVPSASGVQLLLQRSVALAPQEDGEPHLWSLS